MLALIDKKQVVAAAIYNFVTKEFYSAYLNGGAYKNGKRIRVSQRPLQDALLTFEVDIEKGSNLELYRKLNDKTELMNTYNCGWTFSMIASGKLDGRVVKDGWGKDWDYAPGSLIVKEAGGVVANLGKSTYDYRNHDLIATNPVVFKELTNGAKALFPIHDKES